MIAREMMTGNRVVLIVALGALIAAFVLIIGAFALRDGSLVTPAVGLLSLDLTLLVSKVYTQTRSNGKAPK